MATHGKKDPLRREAYILRQLKSMYEWRGNLVHQTMSNFFVPALNNGENIEFNILRDKALEIASQQHDFSEKKHYRTTEVSKTELGLKYGALLCHEGGDYSRLTYEDVCQHLEKSLKNLTENLDIQQILDEGNKYLAETNLPFSIDNTSIAAIADLIIKKPNNKLTLIDWKVGESETSNYSLQLLVYSLGLLYKWNNVAMDDIEAYEINLLKNKVTNHPITAGRISGAEDLILISANEMEALTEGKKYDFGKLKDFNYARTEKSCIGCKFRSLCTRLTNGKAFGKLI
jgi:hypothetical protein